LTSFLRRRNISEIHFVGAIENPSYNGFLQDLIIPLRKPGNRKPDQGHTNLKTEIKGSFSTKIKTQLLADHLACQIIRLGESTILGKHIDKAAIRMRTLVYDPFDDRFLNTVEINLRAMLLQGICFN